MAVDFSSLSDADLKAITSGDMSKVSDAGLAAISGKAPPAPPQSFSDSLISGAKSLGMSGIVGPVEAAAHFASAAPASLMGNLAGLTTPITNAVSGTNYDPQQAKDTVQNGLTYDPRSDAGKAIVGTAGNIASNTVGKVAGAVGDSAAADIALLGGGQSAQDVARAGGTEFGNQLPTFLGAPASKAGTSAVAQAAKDAVDAAPSQTAIDAARTAGYHLPPSEITSAPVGKTLTGVAGKDQLNAAYTLTNQKVTNSIAKTEAQLPANVPLTKQALDTKIAQAGTDYDAVRKADQNLVIVGKTDAGKPIVRQAGPVRVDTQYGKDIADIGKENENASFGTRIDPQVSALKAQYGTPSAFTPADGLNSIKDLRAQARANMTAVDNPAQLALGKAQTQTAAALEDQISRYLDKTGQTSLYNNFEASRTLIAKAKTIRDAIDASGNVDASAINAYRDAGGKVTGGLKQIADAADSFKRVVRNSQGVQSPAPLSAFDYALKSAAMAGGAAAGGEQLAGRTGAGVAGAATLGSLVARPAARSFLDSNFYQKQLGAQTPQAGTLSTLASKLGTPIP